MANLKIRVTAGLVFQNQNQEKTNTKNKKEPKTHVRLVHGERERKSGKIGATEMARELLTLTFYGTRIELENVHLKYL